MCLKVKMVNQIILYQLTAIVVMSYFQKYQRLCVNSGTASNGNDFMSNENNCTSQFKKNSDSRQSYLKAFKKYYIDQLIKQRGGNSLQQNQPLNQDHLRQTIVKDSKRSFNCFAKSCRDDDCQRHLALTEKLSEDSDYPKINRNKIVALVNNNDNQLQELLYDSITQVEREMMTLGDPNDLTRENKMLKSSIQKLKLILKQKLQIALKRNKEELTLMFDEYSTMIKKLLDDKQKLTTQLEFYKSNLLQEQQSKRNIEDQYQNKIRIIVNENNVQISNTKQQIEQFLDMIIQYEQEANNEKGQLESLREKVIDLQMENDKLRKESQSFRDSNRIYSIFHQTDSYTEVERYALKIQNLLNVVDRLQEENKELHQFLKTCKCSRMKSKSQESDLCSETQSLKNKYEEQLIDTEKQFISEEMMLREAIRRKDQCIDRLNLVIQQMRNKRYQTVDRMTKEALTQQPK